MVRALIRNVHCYWCMYSCFVNMNKTTFGYELKATGYNPDASKYRE
ncbi:MAG: hypothetical protein ACLS85_05175 [Coprobacillus cateniformis]